MLPVTEYEALLTLSPKSAVWTWHNRLIDAKALSVFAGRIPGMAGGILADSKERPLGLFLARLLFELGALTHMDGRLEVRPVFLDEKGRVRLRFSAASPWGVREVSPEVVNEFLSVALIVGDGLLRDAAHEGEGVRGYEVNRALELLWDAPSGGRAILEADSVEDLVFGFEMDGGELRLVNCGKPRFHGTSHLDLEGWTRLEPPTPHACFPETYRRKDPLGGSDRRIFVPGTEAGGELRLYGMAFEAGADRNPISAYFQDAGPTVRVHFEYVPGWEAVPLGRQRIHLWSRLSEAYRGELMARSLVCREV